MNSPTKLPPLRPVITEREKALAAALKDIKQFAAICMKVNHFTVSDMEWIISISNEALNFKYGGGE